MKTEINEKNKLLEALNQGKLKRSKNASKKMDAAKQAAASYLRKRKASGVLTSIKKALLDIPIHPRPDALERFLKDR